MAAQQPPGERGQGEGDDDGDEDCRHSVGEALDFGLAVLGVLDQAGHLGQLGVGSDAGGPDDEATAGVDGGTDDGVAGPDLDGHWLSGEHGGVDGRRAVLDDTVGGDLLPRTHDEPVPDRQLAHGHAHLCAVTEDGDVLGAHVEQGAQRRTGLALGAGLEVAARDDEGGDRGRHFEVDVDVRLAVGEEVERHPHPGHPGVGEQQCPQRPQPGGGDADRDQGVHGGGAVTGVGHRGSVERPGTPDHDG